MQGYNNGDGRSVSGDSVSGFGFGGNTMGGSYGDTYVASPSQPPPPPPTVTIQHQPMTPVATGSITQFATPPPQPQYAQHQHQQQYVPQQQSMSTPSQLLPQYGQTGMMQQPYGQPQYAPQPVAQQQQFVQPHQQFVQTQPGMQTVQNTYVTQHQPPTGTSARQPPSPIQPPPPQSNGGGGGSFAARSAAAHAAAGGTVQYQQQQQPQTMMQPSPQQQHQVAMPSPQQYQPSVNQPHPVAHAVDHAVATPGQPYSDTPAVQAQQNRILTDCTRKVQEHAYYMKQAMEKDDLPIVLERAVYMLGELGDGTSSQLTPKNYYELHMRALDDMPNLEEFLVAFTSNGQYKMRDLYDQVQYCPKVLPRLYLQICAGSALIRSKEESAKWVLADLIDCVKCVQNPVRGLFLRHFLLQVTRDKLPDSDEVKDAIEFVLGNFIEMNKLWVRIQHLPGDGKTKEQRKRRERERNELRILVGTNLVRLSQLEGVASQIYGERILPTILEQVTVCGDPLAQAYLIDCVIQVFPDEYHIETLPILLAVCPKLRDKVNIRTILQSLMDRLANYYADEELLDEADTNQVKKSMAKDSFPMFEECVQQVYNARGPKLVAKEVIRLQTALLNFSLKCYPGNMEQVNRCLGACDKFVRQAGNVASNFSMAAAPNAVDMAALDEASVGEMEKMLSIPLDSLALKVLELDHYADLLQFLPWENRRDVGISLLRALGAVGATPKTVKQVEELFTIIGPVIRDEQSSLVSQMGNMTVSPGPERVERSREMQEENSLVSKLVHLLDNADDEVAFAMLSVARNHLSTGGPARLGSTLVPVVFSALKLAARVHAAEQEASAVVKGPESRAVETAPEITPNPTAATDETAENTIEDATDEIKDVSPDGVPESVIDTFQEEVKEAETPATDPPAPDLPAPDPPAPDPLAPDPPAPDPPKLAPATSKFLRNIFVFLQSTVAMIATGNSELGVKLYIDVALAADKIAAVAKDKAFTQIAVELISQGVLLHEEDISESKSQERCVVKIIGALLAFQTLSNEEYERFITKAAQFSAKLVKKQEQCRMVALCAHLFYPGEGKSYQNPQRSLECLQRSLKLADSSISASAGNVYLFVELLDHYVSFFEKGNPVVTDGYISGLVALIREHLDTVIAVTAPDISAVSGAKLHFSEVLQHIKRKKKDSDTSERFSKITLE